MEVYLTEEEQLQVIKDWWKKYGTTALLTVTIVMAAVFGWRYWQQFKAQQAEKASIAYEQVVAKQRVGNSDEMTLLANHLVKVYPSTVYASLSSLLMAGDDVNKGKLGLAEVRLNWVIDHGSNSALQEIARIRAARVLLTQQKPNAALTMLKQVDDTAYRSLIDEIKGDILLAQNKRKQARDSYQNALQTLASDDKKRPLLQMKIDQLAVANPANNA